MKLPKSKNTLAERILSESQVQKIINKEPEDRNHVLLRVDTHRPFESPRFAASAAVTRAFPDLHLTIEEQVAEVYKVVTRWTANGTHRDAFLGIDANGKQVTVAGVSIFRITDGIVQEGQAVWDKLDLMQQIDAVAARGTQ